ncbi:MAG: alpha/beta hydrolase [Actinomycetota bacterium]
MTAPHLIPSTDDVRVAVHELGGDGPPLLLCHATGFHGRCWDPTAAHLTDRYRVLAVDLRGHGDSQVPDGFDVDWAGFGHDVLAVIDALDLAPIRCAGWSMGGASIVLAELTRPGTVRSAFLFEPILFPPPPPGTTSPMVGGARKRREVFASRDEAFENYEGRPPFQQCSTEGLRAYVDHGFRDLPDGTVHIKCRGETEARVYETHDNGAFARLGELTGPTITLGMSGDGGRPAELVPMVAPLIPGATVVHFDELTHLAPMEDGAAVGTAVAAAVE